MFDNCETNNELFLNYKTLYPVIPNQQEPARLVSLNQHDQASLNYHLRAYMFQLTKHDKARH